MNSFQKFGQQGETIAREYLEKKNYRPVAANYATRWGELDLVMEDGRTVVFVEVKRRHSLKYGQPEEAVSRWKQKHLVRAAILFLQQQRLTSRMVRFDVLSIGPDGIRHFEDAFTPGGDYYL